ncbi:MAG: adenosylmethionine--8-amino-7-oxononanoate transaminase [Cellvibrionaceae bacterium]|nr:adenosylmethionine--8-amino-7-oxononanoate transaminase [Cellvibrionaceae bacterium]
MNLTIDRQHIWHPYSSISHPHPVFPVASAAGVRLTLEDGRTLIDGMSSWWCALHGYNHPVLNKALIAQTQKMAHVMFGGLTHQPAIDLAEQLIALTPAPLAHIFYCDSGSVAVEVAIKMALQYWQAKARPEKKSLLSLRNGYHGDTFAAMSVCDPVTGMHHLFKETLSPHYFAKAPQCGFTDPWDDHYLDDIRDKITRHHTHLAAVILEPIVQGTGGMRFYSPQFLQGVRELCDRHQLLLIADEIATGFGRTGKLFACEHAAISPDIMCVGKSLTGGYMTLAATLCTEKVGHRICAGESGVLMHGPTFMANPLACAVASASIQLLLASPWQQAIARIEQQLRDELAECRNWPQVESVRTLGAIGVIELKQAVDLRKIQGQFVEQGIWIRPFGKLVYTMPPFIINTEDLSHLTRGIKTVVRNILSSP